VSSAGVGGASTTTTVQAQRRTTTPLVDGLHFFLRRIPGWTDDLELLHAGTRARILRPTPALFLILKCGRMSEADLSDCLGLLALAQRTGMPVDRARVLAHLAGLPAPESEVAAKRREELREALAADPR
jgi:hypothetical protein